MILSSNSKIYKLDKTEKSKKRIDALQDIFNSFNNQMELIKDNRGKAWLYYNSVSPEAIMKRFKKIKKTAYKKVVIENENENEDGITTVDVDQNCETTEYVTQENIDSFAYQHYPLIQEHVDKYIANIISRKSAYVVTDSDNIALAMYANSKIPNYLNDENFIDIKTNILQDQLIKGLGICRNRIYEIQEKTQLPKFTRDKEGKTIASFEDYTNKIKEGVFLEYVDVDNVFYNPDDKEMNEFFIINHYDIDTVKQYYPVLSGVDEEELKSTGINKYKLHEHLKYIYDRNVQVKDSLFDTYLKTIFSKSSSCNLPSQYNSYEELYYSNEMSKLNLQVQEGLVKIVEYYNIRTRKYTVYLDEYILYDGSMLEPFDHSPLTLFRYKSVGTSDNNTQSLAFELMNEQKKLNNLENDIYKAHKISLVNIIEVCEEKLPNKDEEITLDIATMVRTNVSNYLNTFGGAGLDESVLAKIPLITQNPIQITGLQVSTDIFNRIISFVEKRFPNIQSINNQMPRELVTDILYSVHLDLNRVITHNQAKMSEVCRKLLISNMFFDYYQNNTGFIGKLEDKKLAIYFVFSKKEITDKKVELMKLIDDTNKFNYEETKNKLLKNPAFKSILEKTQKLALEQLTEFNRQQSEKGLTVDQQALDKATKTYLDSINAKLITEQVVLNTKKIDEQNIMIVTLEDYMDLYDNQKSIQFSYKRTESEIMNQLIKSSEMIKSFGLAYNFDANLIMDMISEATGIGKNLYVPFEQTQMAQSKAIEMTRISGIAQDPIALSAMMKKLNIEHDPAAIYKYYMDKNILMHEAQRDVALIKEGLIPEAMLSELDNKDTSKTI